MTNFGKIVRIFSKISKKCPKMYISQPCARRAPRNPPKYIYFQSVGSIYPIFSTNFEFFDYVKLDIVDILKIILSPKSPVLKVSCPQSRMSSKSPVLKVAVLKVACPQSRMNDLSEIPQKCNTVNVWFKIEKQLNTNTF